MPQNQITDTEDEDEGLPQLTPTQLKYVMARAEGLNASDAYLKTLNGAERTKGSLWACASRMDNNPKVRKWLRSIMRQGAIQAACTFENHLAELAALRDEAKASGNYGAAINAEKYRGQVAGLYIERTLDLTKAKQSDTKALEILERLLGQDAALEAARRLGIEMPRQIEGERLN